MAFSEPKTFAEATRPLNYFNWVVGGGSLWLSHSRTIRLFVNLYTIGFWIFYGFVIYFAVTMNISSFFYDSSPMAAIMYQVLVYTNAIIAVVVPIVAWTRREGVRDSMKRIENFNNIFSTYLGVEKNYRKVVVTQIYYIMWISFLIVTITIVDGIWLRGKTTLFADFVVITVFHHPILLMLVADFTFCSFARYLTKKFHALNEALLNMVESQDDLSHSKNKSIFVTPRRAKVLSASDVDENETRNSNRKRHLLQIIRKTHLELSKEAGELNSIFGFQNLTSMGVSFVMVTGLLYTIYSAFSWKHETRSRLREIIPCSCWCIIYALKIFILSHSCARTSEESQQSGKIIYELIGSATDKEFDEEIQEFALQMIQNPVRFTACGFFTLDHTYIQGVIGSITTYLVILIQMSNMSSSTSNAPSNKTQIG